VNSCLVYYTRFGNTQAVALAIADVLESAGTARALPFDGLTAADLAAADLVVFGSPTHYQNLPHEVRAALAALPKRVLRGKQVAAFDTSVETWGPLMRMTAAHRLLPKLRKLGGKRLVRPATFTVVRGQAPESEERQDKLCEGELERARAWAAGLLAASSS
jgi:flavodoxin